MFTDLFSCIHFKVNKSVFCQPLNINDFMNNKWLLEALFTQFINKLKFKITTHYFVRYTFIYEILELKDIVWVIKQIEDIKYLVCMMGNHMSLFLSVYIPSFLKNWSVSCIKWHEIAFLAIILIPTYIYFIWSTTITHTKSI